MKKALSFFNNYRWMAMLQICLACIFWSSFTSTLFPTLPATLGALAKIWNEGLAGEIITSMKLYLTSLSIATISGLIISGATAFPKIKGFDIGNAFKPAAEFLAKWRYMSLVGFTTIFQIITPDMYWLKVVILVFGIAPWFITSLNNIVEATPIRASDYARTLRMSEWKVALEVKVWGNRHLALEAFRQCAAMGLMMLTVAEKLSKDNGGLGVILAGDEKFHNQASIFAVQIFVLLTIGVFQDMLIRFIRSWWCPQTTLVEEHS